MTDEASPGRPTYLSDYDILAHTAYRLDAGQSLSRIAQEGVRPAKAAPSTGSGYKLRPGCKGSRFKERYRQAEQAVLASGVLSPADVERLAEMKAFVGPMLFNGRPLPRPLILPRLTERRAGRPRIK